ncbi:tol-pal system protein YbgF [Tritonibacter multivorans]|uniref:Cell division coordinator CpoB n=1 Tax=Tritonibacter multivorans TaxID=928856 RepID=A0A0P1GJC9_9RHOB|nr:tol-pal system protein YbgF [Tritonibacter multivorans]MDA7419492.1 tol-pal system protein YbgF [Tritonibacter multivorans]CUH75572.1 tol-pal system protein YbgF [Tritonibacter multivorans]SFC65105.1 tol-pal system protein YbgF [Tritonibacter multivorans]
MGGFRSVLAASALCFLTAVSPALAQQQDQTLADIRQELTVLHVEIQRLKREMSTTGSPTGTLAGGSVLERVGAIEAELQRLTAQTEELDIRIQNVVRDGTNRIGDLEFRLVELEGGDVTLLGEASTLGGDTAAVADGETVTAPDPTSSELAVGEAADFAAAQADLEAGSYQAAADKLAAFQSAYPGSPLGPEADFGRGKALEGLGNTRDAARAYLAAFTAAPTGPKAPDALFELGAALGRLDQVDQACVTLSEVAVRFPSSAAVQTAEAERGTLGCP